VPVRPPDRARSGTPTSPLEPPFDWHRVASDVSAAGCRNGLIRGCLGEPRLSVTLGRCLPRCRCSRFPALAYTASVAGYARIPGALIVVVLGL
jgi:hypothetical protein